MDDTIKIQDTTSAATAATTDAAGPSQTESMWMSFMPMLLIFVVFYFLLIRPQEKKRKEHEVLISGLKLGEEVVTTAGFFGIVTKIDDANATLMLEIAPKIEIKIARSSVVEITSRQGSNNSSDNKANKTKLAKNTKNGK